MPNTMDELLEIPYTGDQIGYTWLAINNPYQAETTVIHQYLSLFTIIYYCSSSESLCILIDHYSFLFTTIYLPLLMMAGK